MRPEVLGDGNSEIEIEIQRHRVAQRVRVTNIEKQYADRWKTETDKGTQAHANSQQY